MNFSTMTPAEIDGILFSHMKLIWKAEDAQALLVERMHTAVGDRKDYGWGRGQRQGIWRMSHKDVLDRCQVADGAARKLFDDHVRQIDLIHQSESVLREGRNEFDSRDGWTRAYLVDNADGHVHNTTACSTWNKGRSNTRFHWLTELSGSSDVKIVELAGERACTVCYPDAPVDLLKRPSKITGPAQQERERIAAEKAAAKAAKDAEQIVVEGIHEIGSRARTKTFKSVRAATNFIASELSSLTWYGMTHPDAHLWESNVALIREALAAKGVDYDYDKALTNARKRTNRDNSGGAKY